LLSKLYKTKLQEKIIEISKFSCIIGKKKEKTMTDAIKFNVDYKKIKVFETYNTKDLKFPFILSLPHSGNVFPQEFLQKIKKNESILHGNEDFWVDELLKKAVDCGICTIKMNVSRVFVDVNRDKAELDPAMFIDYPFEENSVRSKRCRYGIGVIHRVDSSSEEIYSAPIFYDETMQRIEKIYDAYHKKLQSLINAIVKKFGYCFLLDAHSMPSKICTIIDDNKKIDICLGDLFEQSCPQKISKFFASKLEKSGFNVSYNIPYSGAYITFNYCQPRKNVYTLQLEINRSLYMDEDKKIKNAEFQTVAGSISDAVCSLAKKMLDFK